MESVPSSTPPPTVEENIRSVVDMERNLVVNRTLVDRVADLIAAFSGSMTFVAIHVVWFVLWFLINTRVLPWVKPFDPYPFILLAMIVSVEGVILSTFVLMKQNRLQQRIDMRDNLNLQVDLLAEKEVTKSLQLLQAICRHLEIHDPALDEELQEMESKTSVDMLANTIKREIPQDL